MIKIPKFANEAKEVAWWDSHRAEVEENFRQHRRNKMATIEEVRSAKQSFPKNVLGTTFSVGIEKDAEGYFLSVRTESPSEANLPETFKGVRVKCKVAGKITKQKN